MHILLCVFSVPASEVLPAAGMERADSDRAIMESQASYKYERCPDLASRQPQNGSDSSN